MEGSAQTLAWIMGQYPGLKMWRSRQRCDEFVDYGNDYVIIMSRRIGQFVIVTSRRVYVIVPAGNIDKPEVALGDSYIKAGKSQFVIKNSDNFADNVVRKYGFKVLPLKNKRTYNLFLLRAHINVPMDRYWTVCGDIHTCKVGEYVTMTHPEYIAYGKYGDPNSVSCYGCDNS